jgi:hypothetical protein
MNLETHKKQGQELVGALFNVEMMTLKAALLRVAMMGANDQEYSRRIRAAVPRAATWNNHLTVECVTISCAE